MRGCLRSFHEWQSLPSSSRQGHEIWKRMHSGHFLSNGRGREYFQFCHSRVQSFIGLLEGGGRAQDMPPLRHKTLPSRWLACLWWHSGRICGWSHAEPARLQVSPGPHPDWWSRTVACSCYLPSWEGCVAAVVHSDPCLLPPAAGYRTEKSKWLIEIVDWWVVSQN